jgi:uncharacterized protein (TIGR02145 family)
MKKLFVGFSFAAMALLAACGGDSGSSADNLDESSSSVEMEGIESSDSEDLNSNGSEGSEGESSGSEDAESSGSGEGKSSGGSEEPESSGSEGVEGSSASVSGGSSDDAGVSSDSEELNSSASEGTSSDSEDGESSGSVEGSSASVPAGGSDASVYDADKNTMTDLRDGQVYKTTTIAPAGKDYSEVWMAENLNYRTDNSWCGGGSGMTEGDCFVYGRLYTWSAAMDSVGEWSTNGKGCGYGKICSPTYPVRGVCPKGWHLPRKAEWGALISAVGGASMAGTKLKSISGWNYDDDYGNGGNGTDTYSFSALPAGARDASGGFYNEGIYVFFWSSTEGDKSSAYETFLYYGVETDYRYTTKYHGFSVRCLKD